MIENLEYLSGMTPLSFPVKGPKGRPLTTTDDIAVKILVDNDNDYSGYMSLSEVLTDLITAVKGPQSGDTSEAIDTLTEVYNFLTKYKDTETLMKIEDVSEDDINSLFNED